MGAGSGAARELARRTAVLVLRDLGGMLMYRSLLETKDAGSSSLECRTEVSFLNADERKREADFTNPPTAENHLERSTAPPTPLQLVFGRRRICEIRFSLPLVSIEKRDFRGTLE